MAKFLLSALGMNYIAASYIWSSQALLSILWLLMFYTFVWAACLPFELACKLSKFYHFSSIKPLSPAPPLPPVFLGRQSACTEPQPPRPPPHITCSVLFHQVSARDCVTTGAGQMKAAAGMVFRRGRVSNDDALSFWRALRPGSSTCLAITWSALQPLESWGLVRMLGGWGGWWKYVRGMAFFAVNCLIPCIPPPLVCLLVACKLKLVKAI